ncbi:MAG TPA: hypothetical protein VET88_14690 [Gammaproteobacteria bacterium]|nr:hypothetical protein [Gammaproteobacteria bacterium]
MKPIGCILLSLVFCSLVSGAAVAGGSTGWVMIDVINQRDCATDRGLEVTFTTTHANPDACNNPRVVEVDCSLATYKQLLAMVLTAQSASMEANAYVSGCDADGQAKMTSMRIR